MRGDPPEFDVQENRHHHGILACEWLLEQAQTLALHGARRCARSPAPSWGNMHNTAKNFVDNTPWTAIWPGLSSFARVLSFNLLGDRPRDTLDPRQR